jgi:formamidopyrimidine-DNA glycosylase
MPELPEVETIANGVDRRVWPACASTASTVSANILLSISRQNPTAA